jgi:hypothetical protein
MMEQAEAHDACADAVRAEGREHRESVGRVRESAVRIVADVSIVCYVLYRMGVDGQKQQSQEMRGEERILPKTKRTDYAIKIEREDIVTCEAFQTPLKGQFLYP